MKQNKTKIHFIFRILLRPNIYSQTQKEGGENY